MMFVRVAATRALFGRTSCGFSQEVQKKGSRLYTWGANSYAVGREAVAHSRDIPQSVDLDSPVVKVANGKKHALLMTGNGWSMQKTRLCTRWETIALGNWVERDNHHTLTSFPTSMARAKTSKSLLVAAIIISS